MKVVHKNSREEISTVAPHYYKMFGMYGFLVVIKDSVFFIDNDGSCNEVTEGFEITSV